MISDPKNYLAATVLNDGKVVSYRLLSRELKVHSNVAKKMLYDFHQRQTSKKPGSVHATYLVDGIPTITKAHSTNGQTGDGEDAYMQNSPVMSSSLPQEETEEYTIPSKSIMLAREEDLQAVKSKFARIRSVHIYSLGPSFVQNLQILSECNSSISSNHAHEDPLVVGKQYGVIQNSGRRTGRRTPALPMPIMKSKDTPKHQPQGSSKSTFKATESSDRPSSAENSGRATSQNESKPASKPALVKQEQSDISKSFSKPNARMNKEKPNSSPTVSSAPVAEQAGTRATGEDEPMKDSSEGEQEAEFTETNKQNAIRSKSQSERTQELRKMMDESDEEMEGTGEELSQNSEPIPTPKEASPQPAVTVSGGRRRGRRKVMKKKTIKDEEGYLVTKEEPAWESFSEDEPATKERTAASSMAKGKKAGGKPGQGNIMSFFGKK
ncbi:hypothetical protein JMJ35_005276 [Cladonia borealis]|uniref:DNA polymerase delta subunit 3 n=1 Tax=Cladonia borealis TaxID=184061 RepID=A0AA39QZN2_9LECA|nr:hypothetical protein JMJ35_005276 [Cladonia borealis]